MTYRQVYFKIDLVRMIFSLIFFSSLGQLYCYTNMYLTISIHVLWDISNYHILNFFFVKRFIEFIFILNKNSNFRSGNFPRVEALYLALRLSLKHRIWFLYRFIHRNNAQSLSICLKNIHTKARKIIMVIENLKYLKFHNDK